MTDSQNKIDELRTKIRQARRQLNAMSDKLKDLERQRDVLEYNCDCVRLNKDIGVYDIGKQAQANLQSLTFGSVSESLSADLSCSICKGNGKVK